VKEKFESEERRMKKGEREIMEKKLYWKKALRAVLKVNWKWKRERKSGRNGVKFL
jgi:hypothetical protein